MLGCPKKHPLFICNGVENIAVKLLVIVPGILGVDIVAKVVVGVGRRFYCLSN